MKQNNSRKKSSTGSICYSNVVGKFVRHESAIIDTAIRDGFNISALNTNVILFPHVISAMNRTQAHHEFFFYLEFGQWLRNGSNLYSSTRHDILQYVDSVDDCVD